MKYILSLFLATLISYSCFAQRRSKFDWITAFKNKVFISAIKVAHPDILANDVSSSISFDLLGNTFAADEADSVGKAFFKTIKPSPILDFENKKAVLNECLYYYSSPELDKLSRAAYKKYVARYKD